MAISMKSCTHMKKKGEATRDERQMEEFGKPLEDCDLSDMGYRGQKYTWEKGNFAETNIREQLDRGVTNREWLNLFSDYLIQHLPYSFSDHCPIFIQTTPNVSMYGITEPSCEDIIKKLWQEKIGNVLDKLEHTQDGMQRWRKNIKRERIKKLKFL
ncbi:hypothetical protein PVK06_022723 [Gossypium arboreum]|uniref:Reverse transcriptase n=1 Tax=Gossypium arboreum TaxID=29729 RepID=A0ABR0P9E4_GOSAR|nr:hypothetical protein PVK06_022723 [Gossypium arboreum]